MTEPSTESGRNPFLVLIELRFLRACCVPPKRKLGRKIKDVNEIIYKDFDGRRVGPEMNQPTCEERASLDRSRGQATLKLRIKKGNEEKRTRPAAE